ncbi:hypothetical protein JHK84_051273 [Glycine max]|nr:hypothetical protein JHK86_051246 [Glycine max]KAG4937184.1 hypothetical protein JHK85_052103 [Glycine max]KAG5095685.1 hypothetical protein JHK84_051273 [Glycine max]
MHTLFISYEKFHFIFFFLFSSARSAFRDDAYNSHKDTMTILRHQNQKQKLHMTHAANPKATTYTIFTYP